MWNSDSCYYVRQVRVFAKRCLLSAWMLIDLSLLGRFSFSYCTTFLSPWTFIHLLSASNLRCFHYVWFIVVSYKTCKLVTTAQIDGVCMQGKWSQNQRNFGRMTRSMYACRSNVLLNIIKPIIFARMYYCYSISVNSASSGWYTEEVSFNRGLSIRLVTRSSVLRYICEA